MRSIAANGLKFTVSAVPNGPAVTLQTGTGTMNAIAISNHEYYVSGVGTAMTTRSTSAISDPEVVAL